MKPTFRTTCLLTASAAVFAAFAGCKHTIAVEPIEVKPIYMTLDINLKVDRELDTFYDFENPPTTTAPASPVGATPAEQSHPDSSPVEGGSR